jgi:hypothetical protein
MEAAGLDARELRGLKGSAARKMAIARVIRQRATVSTGWIAGLFLFSLAGRGHLELPSDNRPIAKE